MTGTYDWNPMPHKVDIKCPSCGEHALFEFAEVVKISLKKDVPFFEQSDLFEYYKFKDSCGHLWHGAVYYANLHGGSTLAIRDLPEGYKPEDWNHSKYLMRNHGTDLGAVSCSHCQMRKPYVLQWPNDAYFNISIKGQELWAFNRESAVELRDYIASSERKTDQYKWSKFLLHIPTTFKKQNVRDSVVKKINKAIES
ncbi:hypothetical protein FLM48_10600 [Shewanella sp. Scap07]|uniref:hypothetical protein n=1 Tax=Shewanella sp. Scap07 TaxID=2589987 RepID=UPI0015BB1415|nr:hypothetical protein [Shewanella sp. Scap07]QLE85486.1 hypothetical protein FLM48_10600 [Shewanella sp. Scap07]